MLAYILIAKFAGTNEAGFWKKLRTIKARSNFTGPYKKKKVYSPVNKSVESLPRSQQ